MTVLRNTWAQPGARNSLVAILGPQASAVADGTLRAIGKLVLRGMKLFSQFAQRAALVVSVGKIVSGWLNRADEIKS